MRKEKKERDGWREGEREEEEKRNKKMLKDAVKRFVKREMTNAFNIYLIFPFGHTVNYTLCLLN